MALPAIAIVHYSASPVVGGVEAVIDAHARLLVGAGYAVTVVAGRGAADALPSGVDFVEAPLMDSQHPEILAASAALEQGVVPTQFDRLTQQLASTLAPILAGFEHVIAHNVFTKHFNLPLTAALHQLLDAGQIRHMIAWCHDFTWTSPNSRSKVHDGDPWNLLRTRRSDTAYVVVSAQRQRALAELMQIPVAQVRVVYNGVDASELLGLSVLGAALIRQLKLFDAGLNLLMPVRVTKAKNIEYALQVVAALKQFDARPKLVLTGPPDPHDAQSMAYFASLQRLRAQLDVEEEMRFVFESAPQENEPLLISSDVVGDFYRLADVMFMPSHREGFGMPVLEAGLAGIPVVASNAVPAAAELAEDAVLIFDPQESPTTLAHRMLEWLDANPQARLRRRVRQHYTWEAIFRLEFRPLLQDRPREENDA